MKKLIMLLILLLALTTTGCKTTQKKNEKILPPTPKRVEIQKPTSDAEYAVLLVYYEYLVQEWEAWGETVKTVIQE